MQRMFHNAASFDGSVAGFDTSKVTDPEGIFHRARASTRSSADTSQVTAMTLAFAGASAFNQKLDGWDTSAWER